MKIKILLFAVSLCCISAKPQKLKWVALGDSITYLNDHLDETGNRVSKGYITRVCEKIPNLSYINQGHNGWTAKRIAEKISELNIEKADYYTVFLGTNDWWAGIPAGSLDDYINNTGTETVSGSFRIILNHIKLKNPKAKIILISPMQRGDFVYINSFKNKAYGSYQNKNEKALESIVNALETISNYEKYDFINLYTKKKLSLTKAVKFKRLRDPKTGRYRNFHYPEYTKIPFDPEKDEYPYPPKAIKMTYDGLHPSDKGNAIIAQLLIETFKKNAENVVL